MLFILQLTSFIEKTPQPQLHFFHINNPSTLRNLEPFTTLLDKFSSSPCLQRPPAQLAKIPLAASTTAPTNTPVAHLRNESTTVQMCGTAANAGTTPTIALLHMCASTATIASAHVATINCHCVMAKIDQGGDQWNTTHWEDSSELHD